MSDEVIYPPVADLYKSNEYIKILQIKKQMTLNQQKIFDSVLSTVQEMSKNGEIVPETLVREGDLVLDYDLFYSHMVKGSRIKKINRKDIELAMRELVSIVFSWSSSTEIGAFVLFQKAILDFKTRSIKDFRTENMLPSANYTALSYEYLNKFKSQYSRLLYQYFKMLIGKDISKPFRTDINLELTFLFSFFGITEETHKEYIKSTGSFLKRCIEPAKKEINLHTELTVNYVAIKKGRFIHSLHFTFAPKENYAVRVEVDPIAISKAKVASLFEVKTLKEFKAQVINKYSGREIGNHVPGFLEETILSLDEVGYIINSKTKKLLSSAESHQVWSYFFNNQSKLGVIHVITDLLRAKKYIGRYLTTYSSNTFGSKEIITLIITNIKEESEGFRLVMRNKFDFQNEHPITSSQLYSLHEIENIRYVDE